MPDRRECPQCHRARWIPLATAPYCAESCERAARRQATVAAPLVACCVCGHPWRATDPRVLYRSLDGRWWCSDEEPCTMRARATATPAELAAMYAALDAAWDQLERDGWRI